MIHADRWWKIEEALNETVYIIWPETYATKEAAEAAIPEDCRDRCRAIQYHTGAWKGGVRV